jgi:hypothetical protein
MANSFSGWPYFGEWSRRSGLKSDQKTIKVDNILVNVGGICDLTVIAGHVATGEEEANTAKEIIAGNQCPTLMRFRVSFTQPRTAARSDSRMAFSIGDRCSDRQVLPPTGASANED